MEKRTNLHPTGDRPHGTTDAWEIENIHRYFPKHTHDEVIEAMDDCKQELGDVLDRNRLLECMQTRLLVQAADGVD